ncbi:MAG: capsule biosynthesis protein [Gemmobacter sp.]
MTTRPKARRFRIRRTGPLGAGGPGVDDDGSHDAGAAHRGEARASGAPAEDGFGPSRFPTAAPAPTSLAPPAPAATGDPALPADTGIDAIRHEGLTGRQLRMARRVAQRHGIAATSDYDAVRLLRKAGIDPFQRATVLELVAPRTATGDGGADEPPAGSRALTVPADPRLPRTIRPGGLPSVEHRAEVSHAADVLRIQRDIARRRRRRFMLLMTRLLFFVGLPTLLAAYYYYAVATPLYATRSEFVIQQAEGQAAGGLGGLFAGTQFATSQDSIAVQGYLQSRDAMIRLDRDVGFRPHFSHDGIDPIQRLPADAGIESSYRLYGRNVKISYDPTEGIIKMEVIAPDPEVSASWSRALIAYAEEQVDHLTQRLRADQMQGARASYEEAEEKMLQAQMRVVELQERFQVLSSEVEVTLITTQISNLESQLTQDRLAISQMLSNPSPNRARLEPLQRRVATLEEEIATLRARLTESGAEGLSLARVQSELVVAEANVATRQMMLAQALQQLETARIEANRQVRYLSVSVSPTAPDEATYPRAFENTVVAMLIFSGIYLMIAMTASILREQVSA